jgi:penicillin-binding protein 1C
LNFRQLFIILLLLFTGVFLNAFIKPKVLNEPYAYVLYDENKKLLGAHIAIDGQWRFPPSDSVPLKFIQCITQFEDHRFYSHNGTDNLAFIRAFWLNAKNRKIVSGGSTITMQTIRLSRKGKARTVKEKIIEVFLAKQLEQQYSKNEILKLYASTAPFGGNIVGLKAAAWRYFERSPFQLSWSESALLAVLPNSPSLIHPGKNRDLLLAKRNKLLKKLYSQNLIDSIEYELSLLESIPKEPNPFPQTAYHLLQRTIKEKSNQQNEFHSTIKSDLQIKVNKIVIQHHNRLQPNDINNIAVLILDVETGKTLAYTGNIPSFKRNKHSYLVDVIKAPRSTGSILKPFLYSAMLSSGEILPYTLVPDIPTFFGGYYPKNFNLGYDGVVCANRALARSLNIPAVKMLQNFGIEKFHNTLQEIGLSTIKQSPSHYGLSLILGGADGTLWDICGAYASMARSLKGFTINSAQYQNTDYHAPYYIKRESSEKSELINDQILSAGSIWLTFNAMIDVERPDSENNWQFFSSDQKIAWKTGTSFGFRDAWAIGLNTKYVVGVWVGNADGEGRPDLIGIRAAAPILFDVFKILPKDDQWFNQPFDDMEYVATCKESGYLPNQYCNNLDSIWIPKSGIQSDECPFHQLIHLDMNEEYSVNDKCYSPHKMHHKVWFVLPPAMEWYYKKHNSNYKSLPPLKNECIQSQNEVKSMQIIYPANLARIYIPIEIDGSEGKSIFEVAHRNDTAAIFWYIDERYVGTTTSRHEMALKPKKGKHILTLVDDKGEILIQNFEILSK